MIYNLLTLLFLEDVLQLQCSITNKYFEHTLVIAEYVSAHHQVLHAWIPQQHHLVYELYSDI